METNPKCGLRTCHCLVPSEKLERGERFCSQDCERQATVGSSSAPCGCGHPDCRAKVAETVG